MGKMINIVAFTVQSHETERTRFDTDSFSTKNRTRKIHSTVPFGIICMLAMQCIHTCSFFQHQVYTIPLTQFSVAKQDKMQSEFVFSCSEERITETTSKARLYASFANFSLSDFSDWSCSDFDKSEDGHESIDLLLMDDLVVRRMVRFGSVRVRTHKVTLGDVRLRGSDKGVHVELAF